MFLFIFITFILLLILKKSLLVKIPQINNYLLFLMSFYVYSILSINWSYDNSDSIIYNVYLGIGIFTTVMLSLFIKTNYNVKQIFKIWLFIFLCQLTLAFLEVFYGMHISNSRYFGANISVPTGFYNNENDFATFIVISLPFLLLNYNKNRLIISFILLFAVFIICETSSRTNIITLLLLLLLFIKVLKKRKLAVLIFIMIFFLIITNYESFFSYLEIDRIINAKDESMMVRYNNILLAISAAFESYSFGIGAGGMENYIIQNSLNNNGISAVHNWYFEILGNFGIIMFFGYLLFNGFILYSLYVIIKMTNNNTIEKKISICLLFSNVGFLFGCISMSSVIHFLPYWILLGITLAFININRQQKVVF